MHAFYRDDDQSSEVIICNNNDRVVSTLTIMGDGCSGCAQRIVTLLNARDESLRSLWDVDDD
jgi:hypothetical protein